jgi:16S rRNA (cytosine1402-N4)-methyltransferase
MKSYNHIPVLLEEAVDGLAVTAGKKYIDATLGGGGHTSLIIQKGGIVLGIDQDSDAIDFVSQNQESRIKNKELRVVKGNFEDIKKIAKDNGFEKIDGILFDFGVSSYQLDSSGRGFSIRHDEELDMRMDRDVQFSALDIVNKYPKEKLIDIFYRYGEEHNAKEIATEIVEKRRKGEIRTTKELKEICERISHKDEKIHPATRIFQAIRIEVNNEIEVIKKGLNEAIELLRPNGRMVVISFHSLEDRVVKQMFETFKRAGLGTIITKKPLVADALEAESNKRSRSAKMRIFEKV